MKTYVLEHHHRHGSSVYILQSQRDLTRQDALEYLGDEFEPNREDEWFELSQAEPTTIL